MRKKPAPYTKQKATPRGSNREKKRTIEKRTKKNSRTQRGSNRKNNENKANSIDNKETHQGNIIDKTVKNIPNASTKQ